MADYFPIGHDDGQAIAAHIEALATEAVKQTAMLGIIADTTVTNAIIHDWGEVSDAVSEGLGESLLPVGTQFTEKWTDVRSGVSTEYDVPWNVVHHGTGTLGDGETIPVMFAQWHRTLPFATQFSSYQAFLTAVTVIPAGTYNVTMGFSWGSNVVSGKSYQFTLANDLPIGGQLSGFEGAPDQNPSSWKVKAWSSATATSETETVSVSEGTGGTNLGTFSAAGVSVPASGTPTVTTVGSLQFYGLNSLHRVAYGNNRWMHSPLRQFLNASGSGWFVPATVFDRPPAYAGYDGFLTGIPADMVAAMKPVAHVTALNYITDGGTAASPLTDTTYDKVFIPSWEEHYLQVSQSYGGSVGLEGAPWEYWERVAGTTSPLPASTSGQPATYHTEYVQYDLAQPTTARYAFLRSATRSYGYYVGTVYASGFCGSGSAINGHFAAPACAIG